METEFNHDMAERWHLYKPPARPSKDDVRIYERFMRLPSQSLLLGCTPELRSLAHRFGHDLTVVDLDPEVFRSLERLVDPRGEEEFIHCDWLEMDLNRQFDLVVGDGSVTMLPPAQHERFLERVAAHLRPGGRALLHVHLTGKARFNSPEEVFQWYASQRRGHVFSATRFHLCSLWLDDSSQSIANNEFFAKLKELHARSVIRDEDFATLRATLEDDSLVVYYADRDTFEALLVPHFEVEDVFYSHDYEYPEMKPIYCLRRR